MMHHHNNQHDGPVLAPTHPLDDMILPNCEVAGKAPTYGEILFNAVGMMTDPNSSGVERGLASAVIALVHDARSRYDISSQAWDVAAAAEDL
jgi:hypothetical protein